MDTLRKKKPGRQFGVGEAYLGVWSKFPSDNSPLALECTSWLLHVPMGFPVPYQTKIRGERGSQYD